MSPGKRFQKQYLSSIKLLLHNYQSVIWRGRGSLEASLAPLGVVLELDHTDGMAVPGLEHVSSFMNCVLHNVILQDVIIIMTITIPEIAPCKNYYVPVISGV